MRKWVLTGSSCVDAFQFLCCDCFEFMCMYTVGMCEWLLCFVFRYVCIWICDYGWFELCIVNHVCRSNSVRMCHVCGYFVSGEGEGSKVSALECLSLLELHCTPTLTFRSCTISWPLTSHQAMNPSAQRTCLHILCPAFCVCLFRTR